ncbi:hypothetical protein, conserved [Eimeria tenella]|uniref:Uncharacterized protein n=1 Tax=Eimeria tenella TaxID=5802 RepID=U6KTP3_EIMTE|nr:hypothetical protein, conserved [Eimeria tenella]CDJ40303.1 hypothetical protein, conserved [Eimeria tenella]|eukprot:XP_013231056.1 hypothetical protein, conserved [Eimeria tenella]
MEAKIRHSSSPAEELNLKLDTSSHANPVEPWDSPWKRKNNQQIVKWSTVSLALTSVALLLIVLKCSTWIRANSSRSFRILAEGGEDEGKETSHLLEGGPDISGECESGEAGASGTRRERRHSRRWSHLFRIGPTSQPTRAETSGEEGASASTSQPHPEWTEHQSNINVGEPSAYQYHGLGKPYYFPFLGVKPEHRRLREMLERLGQYAEKLCFPHQQARDKVFDALCPKLDGTGEVHLFVEIQEIDSHHRSAFSQLKSLFSKIDYTHRHFGRDVQAVVEEMIVVVLTEVARSGIPPGGTTPLAIVLEKPHDVPCTGRVLIKVHAER